MFHGVFCLECQAVVGVFWNGTFSQEKVAREKVARKHEGTGFEKPKDFFVSTCFNWDCRIATPHVEAPSNETSGYPADVKETVTLAARVPSIVHDLNTYKYVTCVFVV